ncbi:hypothetical protein V2A85_24060, partial [Yersinia sp. 1252 StPb PI]|uniref:hypothetical protein n=1 Tax=Yersinia sp. 1252 StPb PI TaxID=3117404 RepID=UPI003B27B8F7
YYLSIIVLRRGLSGLFDNYQSSFPDRYFLGLNLLFMIALIYSFDRFKFTRLLSVIAVVPMIFFAKSAFELNKPATKFNTSYTWTSEFCYSLTDRNSVLKGISVPPQGWQMNLDLGYFSELQKNIFNEKCKESVLYQIPFLDKFEPLFLVQKNDTGNSQSLEAKFTGISNGTKIEEHDGYVLVDVNGDDPHILLSSSSLYKIDTNLRASVFLNIKSSTAEVVQIYYSIKGSPGFSEQESIFVDIVPGENPIYINMSNVINPNTLRIDFPEGH